MKKHTAVTVFVMVICMVFAVWNIAETVKNGHTVKSLPEVISLIGLCLCSIRLVYKDKKSFFKFLVIGFAVVLILIVVIFNIYTLLAW